jgi:glutaminyl-tRNA synthetase
VQQVGVTESSVVMQPAMLETCVRNELNVTAPRAMVVLDPIKVTLLGWAAGRVDMVPVPNIPFDESAGTHVVPLCGVLYIEREDFQEVPEQGIYFSSFFSRWCLLRYRPFA